MCQCFTPEAGGEGKRSGALTHIHPGSCASSPPRLLVTSKISSAVAPRPATPPPSLASSPICSAARSPPPPRPRQYRRGPQRSLLLHIWRPRVCAGWPPALSHTHTAGRPAAHAASRRCYYDRSSGLRSDTGGVDPTRGFSSRMCQKRRGRGEFVLLFKGLLLPQ